MRIVLTGRVISKKRGKNVGVNKYTGKLYFTSSKAWKTFEEDALWQLKQYHEKYPGLVRIDYTFYFKGNLWLDYDNALAGINDVLQAAGIIANDRNIRKGSFEIIPAYHEWRTEVEITPL